MARRHQHATNAAIRSWRRDISRDRHVVFRKSKDDGAIVPSDFGESSDKEHFRQYNWNNPDFPTSRLHFPLPLCRYSRSVRLRRRGRIAVVELGAVRQMLRVGLLIYLIVVGLVEPLLCPCFVQHFLTSDSALISGETAQCCTWPCCPGIPSCAHGAPCSGPAPCGSQCPCQSRTETFALPATRAHQVRNSTVKVRQQHSDLALADWSNLARLGETFASQTARDGAFLSPRDRLHRICLLRC